eukprot:4033002-Pleurochrysis_carterae.AAC.2
MGGVRARQWEPCAEVVLLLRRLDGAGEDVLEVLQRVLVHRVDGGEVGHDEVEDGPARRHGPVGLARQVDLLGGLFRSLDRSLGLGRRLLARVESVDQVLVIKNVARRFGKHA